MSKKIEVPDAADLEAGREALEFVRRMSKVPYFMGSEAYMIATNWQEQARAIIEKLEGK